MNPELIQAARGDKTADLLLTNLKLVNVYTGQIEPSEIAILGDTIVGVGPGYDAAQVVDLGGRYVSPGFINAHVHVESSMVTPSEFARAVVALGTTTAVTDPHEMANVCGLEGVRFMLDDGRKAPMTLYVNAPSCVPATSMSTSGAVLNAEHLSQLKNDPNVIGLAEVMNFPGVIHGARDVLDKIEAFADRPIDGHAPTVSGKDLNAYVTAGVGSDHECVTKEEALEKIARGMRVLIREGTAERNLAELLPAVMDNPSAARRCCFCTDDSHPAKLIDEGDVGAMVIAAIEAGLPPVTAIQMATLNAAEWFRLYDRGAIAPGKRADLNVFADLEEPAPDLVYCGGKLVAKGGETLVPRRPIAASDRVRNTINLDQIPAFDVPAKEGMIRVIGVIGDQVVTEHLVIEPTVHDGMVVSDVSNDVLKMAVIDRHHNSGRVGIGFVRGIGLREGAIATTVCHDHHNLIVVGADDESMSTAAGAVVEMGGGEVVVVKDQVLARVPLPIAGLMSDKPLSHVRSEHDRLHAEAQRLGSTLSDPTMTLSFLALEVIPSLKLTDQGLVDVDEFKLVDLWV